MAEPVGEHVADVLVGEAVVDDPPLLTSFYDMARAKQPELVADRGLPHPNQEGKIADAQLLSEAEGVQDPRAVRVGEESEDPRYAVGFRVREDLIEERLHVLGMHALGFATLRRKFDS